MTIDRLEPSRPTRRGGDATRSRILVAALEVFSEAAFEGASTREIAERLHALIPGSRLHLLRGFDHLSILTDGRHQVIHLLGELLETMR